VRVAQLTATFPPYLGGAGTTTFHQAAELSRRGHDVEVWTAAAPGEAPAPGGAVVHRLPPRWAIGNAPLLPGLARLRGYDVLHLQHPFIFGTELVLAAHLRSPGTALVVGYHNRLIGERERRPLFWGWEETWGRALARRADRICVVSEAHADTVDYLRREARREPSKLVEVPNGVDLDRFRPEGDDDGGLRAALGIPSGAVVAAFVATLDRAHWSKRCDLAIEAVARAGDERLHLLVVGAGEWLERHRAEARAAGLTGRVHFAGAQPHEDLPRFLRAADLLLLTSDLESFGIVLLEAMACGLPTVATDPPGVRAVVREGETGLLAPRGDAPALAARLRELVAAGTEGRRSMGAAGRALCTARYGWPAIADRLEAAYAEAIAVARTRGGVF
jgi:glycosyltransferase involved in cell wall biosynthesis